MKFNHPYQSIKIPGGICDSCSFLPERLGAAGGGWTEGAENKDVNEGKKKFG